jgi:hypothetical protein
MKRRGNLLLGLALIALGFWPASSVLALEWPDRGPERCQRCGRVLMGYSVPAPAPSGWRKLLGFGNRGRCCPPTSPCWTELPAAPTTAPAPPTTAPAPPTTTPAPPPTAPGEPLPEQPSPAAPQPSPAAPQPSPAAPQPSPAAPQPSPAAPQPAQPEPTAPSTEGAGAMAAGLGGALAAQTSPVLMFGDLLQFGRLASTAAFRDPPFPPSPPIPPTSRGEFSNKSAAVAPSVRAFKMADNQTPFPVNRLTFSFNFYDYLSQSVNQRFNVPINRLQGYRYIWGFEKTFFDQRASVGMWLPLNTLSGSSTIPGVGRTSTSLGDISMFVKYAFWIDRKAGRVLTGGLALTAPTGPTAFAGAPYLRAVHYADLQPFLTFQWTWDRTFLIGFSAIDVPTGPRDVTMYYNDLALGYYLFRNENPDGLIRAIAPSFETHVNTPLNHSNPFNPRDIAGTADAVNLTEGLNVFLGKRTILSLGLCEPVTGPRPFSVEALGFLSVFY